MGKRGTGETVEVTVQLLRDDHAELKAECAFAGITLQEAMVLAARNARVTMWQTRQRQKPATTDGAIATAEVKP